ncbi:hypothetical protein OAO87_00375 [bacterium]|nr:hypothetical protein [bacterium]
MVAAGSTGAMMSLLRRLSMGESVLCAQKSAMEAELLTADEFAAILDAYRPLAEPEARAKVKKASLVPLSVAVAAVQAFGRCAATTALLKAIGEQPKLWAMKDEQEAHRANLEVDLLLDDAIAEEEGEADVHMAIELETMPAFPSVAEDDAAVEQSWTLSPVPKALERELTQYASYRSSPLNKDRVGGEIMPVTIQGDAASARRFLGFLKATKGIKPELAVFASSDLGALVQDYLNACRAKSVRWCSIANYVNGLLSVTRYAHSLTTEPSLETEEELINLRSQAESQAKVERLYTPRHKEWLEFEDCQKARVSAEAAWRSASGGQAKLKALKEWTLISCFTCLPADRVGVIRLLRVGGTLLKESDGSFTLNLTQMKLHKTSRFTGPSVTSITPLLSVQLNEMLTQIEYDNVALCDKPYLWHVASDCSRPVSSSSFCKMVKDAFQRASAGLHPSAVPLLPASCLADAEVAGSQAMLVKPLHPRC